MVDNRTLLEEINQQFPSPSSSLYSGEFNESFADSLASNFSNEVMNGTEIGNHGGGVEPLYNFIESLFSDDMVWILYAIIAVVSVTVLLVVFFIVRWILKHKTRVIRQDNDPILNSSYGDGITWIKVLCCHSSKKQKEQLIRIRQNSESNLDPYRRRPLPPIGGTHESYIGTYNRSTSSGRPVTVDETTLAINIQGIK